MLPRSRVSLERFPKAFFFYVKYCYGLRSVIGVLFCVIRLLEYVDVRVINGFVFFSGNEINAHVLVI
jgi:hypothetical protein